MMHKCYVLMFFALVFSCDFAFAVTFNGKKISSLIKPNEVLVCTNDKNNDGMSFLMKDGAIVVENLMVENPQDIKTYYQELGSLKNKKLSKWTTPGDVLDLRNSGGSTEFDGIVMTAPMQILLTAETKVDMNDAILKTQEVVFSCLQANLMHVFICADALIMRSNSSNSLIREIRFFFNKNAVIPNFVLGSINFATNQIFATGSLKALIAGGAQRIEIVFAPQAFAK